MNSWTELKKKKEKKNKKETDEQLNRIKKRKEKKREVFDEQLNRKKKKDYQITIRESTCMGLWSDKIERGNRKF